VALDLNKISNQAGPAGSQETNLFDTVVEFFSKDISFSKPKMSDKRKEFFYSELKILFSSGVDIKTAIEIIEEQCTKKNDLELYSGLKTRIVEGASLSEAVHVTGLFSNYEYFSLQIGEESGKLTEVLQALHTFYDNKIKQTRKLVNSFSYPVMVLIMAVSAVAFMMHFMVPMFVDIFLRFDAELPAITQVIVNISNAFSAYAGVFFFLIASLAIGYIAFRKHPRFRSITAGLVLKIPLIGGLVRMVYLQRFFQAMALLISARTPMLRAIQLVKNMVNFQTLETSLSEIEADILQGKLLHESMKRTGFFDMRIVSLIKVAEEVNKLDTIFSNLEQRYSEELEHKVGMLSNMLEPLLIIFVGILVAVILVSMYLPMFQLSTAIY